MKAAVTYTIIAMAVLISLFEITMMRGWDGMRADVEQVIE